MLTLTCRPEAAKTPAEAIARASLDVAKRTAPAIYKRPDDDEPAFTPGTVARLLAASIGRTSYGDR